MAHGKHRRKIVRIKRDDRKLLSMRQERSEAKSERDPLHQADTVQDMQFSLMACEHPGQCSCDTDYPNWTPGQR